MPSIFPLALGGKEWKNNVKNPNVKPNIERV